MLTLKNKKRGFTLLETVVTVIILGVLAAILIPPLILRQIENNNRSRIKKAITVYEQALRNMVIENGLKNNEAIIDFGTSGTCNNTRPYFKSSENGENNCIFKTGDGIWWNIADIENPIISIDTKITAQNLEKIKTNAKDIDSDTTSFAFVGSFDESQKSLRVNDNTYEKSKRNNSVNQKYMSKLWYYIIGNDSNSLGQFEKCMKDNTASCKVSVDGTEVNFSKIVTSTDITYNDDRNICVYDRETSATNCGSYSVTAPAGTRWISDALSVTEEEAKSDRVCKSSLLTNCSTKGDYYESARLKCEDMGGHIANPAEVRLAINNGKINSHVMTSLEASSSGYVTWYSSYNQIYGTNVSKSNRNNFVCVGD